MTRAVMHLASDAGAKLRTGQTPIEAKYGTKATLPDEMNNFFGNVHGALKTAPQRQGTERAFQKLTAVNIANGVNVDDPMVQTQTMARALQEGNRQIFMEDNIIAKAMQSAASSFNQVNPETGKPRLAGIVAKGIMRTAFPIVRIPTNLVSRTLQAVFGGPVGAMRLAVEYVKGIDNLPPERADNIMRQLKAGALGSAVMLWGYYNAQNVGGYWQPGEKRDPKDVKAGALRIGGIDIPAGIASINPLLIAMQFGATIRRVADSRLRAHDPEPQGVGKGVEAAALGAIQEAPLIRDPQEYGKLFDPHERDKFITDYGESLVVPAGAKWLYNQFVPPETKPQKQSSGRESNHPPVPSRVLSVR